MQRFLFLLMLLLAHSAFSSNHNSVGAWVTEKTKNKLTDETEYFAAIYSIDSNATIVLRCDESKTDAYIATSEYLGKDSVDNITLRIEKEKAVTQSWGASTSGDAVFAPDATAFINSLVGKKELLVGYSPYNKGQMIAEFKINGIDAVAKEIKSTCNWKDN